jgi:hypothetical protein
MVIPTRPIDAVVNKCTASARESSSRRRVIGTIVAVHGLHSIETKVPFAGTVNASLRRSQMDRLCRRT